MQEFDVYRPPGAPYEPGRDQGTGTQGPPVPWDPVLVLQEGWDVVKVHWPVLVFAPFIAGIAEGAPSILLNRIPLDGWGAVVGWLTGTVIRWVLGAFFAGGVARLLLAGARRAEPSFGAIFEGGPWFGKMLGVNVLLGVLGAALACISLAPAGVMFVRDLGLDKNPSIDPETLLHRASHLSAGSWIALLAGGLLLTVLIAFVTLRLMFARYYVVDLGHGVFDALGASWQATRGQVLKLVGFSVLVLLLALGGVMACCLPVVLVVAVARVAGAMIYLCIAGRTSPSPSVPA